MFSQWHKRIKTLPYIFAVLLASCAGGQHAAPVSVDEREAQALQPLVEKYKSNGLMGSDVKGTTLQISADAEKWSQQDEESEAALKMRMLDSWVKTWTAHHPHSHAKLIVRFHNYYGEEMATVAKTV